MSSALSSKFDFFPQILPGQNQVRRPEPSEAKVPAQALPNGHQQEAQYQRQRRGRWQRVRRRRIRHGRCRRRGRGSWGRDGARLRHRHLFLHGRRRLSPLPLTQRHLQRRRSGSAGRDGGRGRKDGGGERGGSAGGRGGRCSCDASDEAGLSCNYYKKG